MSRTRAFTRPVALFSFSALTIVAIAAMLVRSRAFASHPEVASWGLTFDLTITIPAIYWLLVVRSGRMRPATIAPIFLTGAALAALIVPRDQQQFLHQLRLVAVPLDVLTVAVVAQRLIAMRRQAAGHDAESNIRRAVQSLFGSGAAGSAVASEISIAYYALFCWRRQPVIPVDAQPITVHERSGWGSVVASILVLFAAESVGMHLAVQLWSVKAAWIVTALDLYGMLWLVGDYHAIRLRPTLLRAGAIEVRHGLRWSGVVERGNVAAVERVRTEADWKRRRTLKLALLEEPQYVIRLHSPVVVTGIAGWRKTIDSIAVRPDDPVVFERALSREIGGRWLDSP